MSAPVVTASFIAALGLALTQLFVGRLHVVEAVPHRIWVSFAGGVSVAYVFVHLLPELFQAAARIGGVELVSLTILLGFTAAYAVGRLATASSRDRPAPPASPAGDARIFWPHLVTYAVYNALIGFLLLHLEQETAGAVATFAIAMAFHIGVNDTGLWEHHRAMYDRVGRPVLSAAVPLGWAIGFATLETSASILYPGAFLAGAIVLNTIRSELPAGREARLSAFLLGEAIYATILLAI